MKALDLYHPMSHPLALTRVVGAVPVVQVVPTTTTTIEAPSLEPTCIATWILHYHPPFSKTLLQKIGLPIKSLYGLT